MKHRHLIALLQEGYTTIQVVFNDDVRGRSKPYTYKAPLSAGVEVGDRVVVDSPSKGLVVVEVVGTDKAPRIDLDADFTYKWIVQKVELKAYEEQLEREAKAMDALQEVERQRQRDILLQEFQLRLPEGTDARKLFDQTVQQLKGDESNGTASA